MADLTPNPEPSDEQSQRLDELSSDALKAHFLDLTGMPLPKFVRGTPMRRAVAHARERAFTA